MKPLPSVKVFILIATGISIANWTDLSPVLAATAAIISLVLSILFDRKSTSQVFIPVALIASGAFAYQSSIPPSKFESFDTRIIGRICEPVSGFGEKISLSLDNVFLVNNGVYEKLNKKLSVRLAGSSNAFDPGSYIDVSGKLHPFKLRRNPFDFDFKKWRERNGYIGELYTDRDLNPVTLETNTSIIIGIRNFIIKTIDEYIPSETPVIKALILGLRRDLDDEFLDALKTTGLLHLIALSGLHVGFLAAIFFGVGAILRLSLPSRVIFSICGIILFLLLVPPRASTLRAALMIILLISGPVLKRWSPPMNTVGFAGILILCFRPGDLFDVGFQFSFAAISGLVMFRESNNRIGRAYVEKRGKIARTIKRFILMPFLISVSASIMIMPFTAFHFGYITPATPLFNLLAIPLLSLIYVGGWLMLFLSVFSATLASLVSDSLQLLIFLWEKSTLLMANISPCLNSRLSPFTILMIISTIIWAAYSNRRALFRAIAVVLIITSLFTWDVNIRQNSSTQVWFIDVGQGDATIIRLPNKETYVIDAGPAPKDPRYNAVVNMLDKMNGKKVDLLVASHPDADHIGGMGYLIEQYPVSLAITTSAGSETDIFRELVQTSFENNLDWQTVVAGDVLNGISEKCKITVLNPPQGSESWSTNDASLVLMVSFEIDSSEYAKLLLTGDIGEMAESLLIRTQHLKAGLLKASHHGSNSSNSLEFLNAVKPEYTIISRSGRFESGTRKTKKRLEELQINTIETVTEGAILFEPKRSSSSNWCRVDWRNPPFLIWFLGRNF